MTFYHNKHNVEQFAYDLKVPGKIKKMLGEQVLEHFKESFAPKIESYLLKINDIDTAIGKARVLVLLFKSELPQFTSSLMFYCT